MTATIDSLRETALFRELGQGALSRLRDSLVLERVARGTQVYRQGDETDRLHGVESGLVRLTIEQRGAVREVGACHRGDVFGLHNAISGSARSETAIAIVDSEIWSLDALAVRALLGEHPAVARAAAGVLAANLGAALGSQRGMPRAATSHISVVLVGRGAAARRTLIDGLLHGLACGKARRTLVLSSLAGSARAPVATTALTRHEPDTRELHPGVEWANLPGLEFDTDLDLLSAWLRARAQRFERIVLLTKTGSVDYRMFVMGLCQRSATLLDQELPEFLRFLKPGRDRAYLLAEHGTALDRFVELERRCPGVVVPALIPVHEESGAGVRLGRWLAQASVGVAFGGGGACALAHIGVLEGLEGAGVPVDMASATSAGAHVAGLHALGMDAAALFRHLDRLAFRRRRHPFSDYRLSTHSMIRGRRYERLLKAGFGNARCIDTRIPFFPVAANMHTGEEFVITRGRLCEAVLASGSVPTIFPLFRYGELLLGDGGLVNYVPASILHRFDTDFVISVDTSVDPARAGFRGRRLPQILMRTIDILLSRSLETYRAYSDLVLVPDVDDFSATDYPLGPRIVERGRAAIRERLPELVALLGERGIALETPTSRPADDLHGH